jgi:hypothetical protein
LRKKPRNKSIQGKNQNQIWGIAVIIKRLNKDLIHTDKLENNSKFLFKLVSLNKKTEEKKKE